jgi:hypothetical protein
MMEFSTKLVRPTGVGTWTFAPIPVKISQREGHRSHQRVKGEIDGVAFSSSLMPRGGGEFFLVVSSALRERIGKEAGDRVKVRIELDTSPPKIVVPSELRSALARDRLAKETFQALAPSRRKAFALWVDTARRKETRVSRATRVREMVLRGETPN